MTHVGWIAATATVLSIGCGEAESARTAALFVEVRDPSSRLVDGATVTTRPTADEMTTDASGSVFFSRMKPGKYQVVATHEALGAASDAVVLEPDELVSIQLRLQQRAEEGPSGQGGTSGVAGSGSGRAGAPSAGGAPATAGRSGGNNGGRASGGSANAGSGPVIAGEYIDVETQVESMLVDAKRPYLYALDRVNNSFVFVNLDSREVESTIFVGSSPVDMAFGETGDEVYVANFGSTEIAVVDLDAQKVGRTMFVETDLGTWDGNPYRLAVTAGGTLAFTSEDQWCDIKLVDASNGKNIAAVGTINEPDLLASPDGTKLYAGESAYTGSKLIRFDVAADTLTQVDQSTTVSEFGSRLVVMSGDGDYLFYAKKKYLASNLQSVLGEFSEVIYAANEDGTIVIGNTNVFDGTNFRVLSSLPVSTTNMAVAPDFETVYLYELNTSRIYIHDLSQ